MRPLTKEELNEVNNLKDMLNGNINRMCVSYNELEMVAAAKSGAQILCKIGEIVKRRGEDDTKEDT